MAGLGPGAVSGELWITYARIPLSIYLPAVPMPVRWTDCAGCCQRATADFPCEPPVTKSREGDPS